MLTSEHEAFIRYARVARLATVDETGHPHVVPVCPVLMDGKIFVASEDNKKVRNIRANPKVALAFDDYVEDWTALRGLLVTGVVDRVIERGPEFGRSVDALYAKFPQYEPQAGPIEEGSSVILEISILKVAGEI